MTTGLYPAGTEENAVGQEPELSWASDACVGWAAGSTILAGPMVQDHVHRLSRIPP